MSETDQDYCKCCMETAIIIVYKKTIVDAGFVSLVVKQLDADRQFEEYFFNISILRLKGRLNEN